MSENAQGMYGTETMIVIDRFFIGLAEEERREALVSFANKEWFNQEYALC